MKIHKEQTIAIIVYAILTPLMTLPLLPNITTHVAGDGGDSLQDIWNIWWAKKAFFENKDLYYSDYQFYPIGASLTFESLSISNLLLSLPLQLISNNLVFVYNTLFLFSFMLSGYGMFLLVSYLVKNYKIGIVAGIAYAFSPYHFAQGLGHLNLLSIQWIPFYILFLIKMTNNTTVKNSILAGIFLLLVSLTSWQYMIAVVAFTFIYLAYLFLSNKKSVVNRSFLKKLALSIAIFGVTILPFAYPMVEEFSSYDYMRSAPNAQYSFITPFSYVIPSPLHPIFGNIVKPFYSNWSDSVSFLGYTILFFAVFLCRRIFKKIKFWVISSLLFFILSLNPNSFFGVVSPVHTLFYVLFPFFSVLNNMGRFSIMVVLQIIVIFSFGIKEFLKSHKAYRDRFSNENIIIFVLSSLILFEFLSVPFIITDARLPDLVYKMKQDHENYTILDIPPIGNSGPLYLQTVHEKKFIGGYVSRIPTYSIEFLKEMFIQKANDTIELQQLMKKYDTKYIFVWKNSRTTLSMGEKCYLKNFLDKIPKNKIYENDVLIAYNVEYDSIIQNDSSICDFYCDVSCIKI